MSNQGQVDTKTEFKQQLTRFVETLQAHISTEDDQWTVKGFIDVFRNVYTISADTKIVSKILEIHLFPKLLEFAQENGYHIVVAEQQNYYPDLSFVKADDETVKFAVDLKTTYRCRKNLSFATDLLSVHMVSILFSAPAERISNSLMLNIMVIFVWALFTRVLHLKNRIAQAFIILMDYSQSSRSFEIFNSL